MRIKFIKYIGKKPYGFILITGYNPLICIGKRSFSFNSFKTLLLGFAPLAMRNYYADKAARKLGFTVVPMTEEQRHDSST